MNEFKVNDYITLKLENERINIYVDNKRFRQCRFLLLDIPITEMKSLDEIESIDEALDKLRTSKPEKIEIPIETEFWGHCSNLQVWVENNYNTSLLHRDIAFPLLRELTKAGDKNAESVFKKEILRRLESKYPPVSEFLIRGWYLKSFDEEELKQLFQNDDLNLLESFINVIDNSSWTSYDYIFSLLKYITDKQFFERILPWFQYKDIEDKINILRGKFIENLKMEFIKDIINDSLMDKILDAFRPRAYRWQSNSYDAIRALEETLRFLPDKYKDRIINELPNIDFKGFMDLLQGGFSRKGLKEFSNETQKRKIESILDEKLINWYSSLLGKSPYSREKEFAPYNFVNTLKYGSDDLKIKVLEWIKTISFNEIMFLLGKGILTLYDEKVVREFLLDPELDLFTRLTEYLETESTYHTHETFKTLSESLPEQTKNQLKEWFLTLSVESFSSFYEAGFLDFLNPEEKIDLITDSTYNYVEKVIEILSKDDSVIIVRAFKEISSYLSELQRQKIFVWIKKVNLDKLVFLLGSDFLNFLDKPDFENLISSISKEILSKLLIDVEEKSHTVKNSAINSLKHIANSVPLILIKMFEESHKISDIKNPLKIFKHGILYRLEPGKLQPIINDPRTHFYENLLNILNEENPEIKAQAIYMLENLGEEGTDFVKKTISILKGEEKCKFLYDITNGGYFYYRENKELFNNLIEQIEKETSHNLIESLLKLFIQHWKNTDYNHRFLYKSYIFRTLSMLKDKVNNEISILLKNKNGLLYLHLYFEGLLDFLTKPEIAQLFNDFNMDLLVKQFMEYNTNAEEWEEVDWRIDRVEKLGEFGVNFLLRLLKEDFEYEMAEGIAYRIKNLAKDYVDFIKKELINLLIEGSYEEIRDLFNFEVANLLEKEDILEIYNNPKSHLLEKLNNANDDKYPPWHIEEFLSKLGKAGGDLIFKMTQKRDYLDHMKGIFKEMGEDLIESFIKHVLINENNYRYGDWGYEFIKIFFDIFSKEQIVSIIESKEYNIVDRLLQNYNPSDRWANHSIIDFFYIAYQKLDDQFIIKIHNRLPESLKKEILQIYEESAYYYTDEHSYRYASSEQISSSQKAKKMVELLKSRVYQINEIISLRLENEKTMLYIKNRPFTQCMQLLLNIPIKNIPNYDEIESIDEASEIYSNTERNRIAKKITPEEEFWAHCSNIQAWVENNYDTRLLHSSIAFPLLKELTRQGVFEAKNLFKEEITKRFLNGNFTVITYLWKQRYLSNFTKEELNTLFHDFDFNKLLKWKIKERYDWLKELIDKNINVAREFFKNHIISLIKDKNWETILHLFSGPYYYSYFKVFTPAELEIIFQDFDYSSFLKYTGDKKLRELKLLESLGISRAKELFRQLVKELFLHGDANSLNMLFRNNYLSIFEEEEIKILLKDFNFKKVLNIKFPSQILQILRNFSRYNKDLVKDYIRKEIEKQFLTNDYKLIKSIVDGRYLSDFFTEEEQKLIVKKIHFEKLKKETTHNFLSLLRQLSPIIPIDYKNELKSIFLSGNSETIELILKGNYLQIFNKEELDKLFQKFDFSGIKLNLLKELNKLGVPIISHKFKEIREKSDDLANLKQEIVRKFENGDYKSLLEMFRKNRYGGRYKDKRLNDLIHSDFHEIFTVLNDSLKFKESFKNALLKEDPPFSVPFKVIISSIRHTAIAKEIFIEQASHALNTGPLNIISFVSRPEYSKYFSKEEYSNVFSFKNEHIKSEVINALNKDSSAPLPLIILKRLAEIGDEEAESYLKEKLFHLINTASNSVMSFLNKDGFLNFLVDLDTEFQLYIAFSPDLDYSAIVNKLHSTKIGELVDNTIKERFNKIIETLQREKHVWIREEDLGILKDAVETFGVDALKGLMALYSRDNQSLQIFAVKNILKLYRKHKNFLKTVIKRKLGHFFKEEFKPYYKIFDEMRAVDEYGELLSEYKNEFNELKWFKS